MQKRALLALLIAAVFMFSGCALIVTDTEKDNARVNQLIYQIGRYAEQQMVWFVVGDVPLNDDTWAEFCETVKNLGIDEMVGIFQNAVN